MTLSLTGPVVEEYAIVALIGLFLLRRSYAMTRGVRATLGRLVVIPGLYVGLYLLALSGLWFAAVGSSLTEASYAAFAADGVLLAMGAAVAFRVTSRDVEIYRPPDRLAWHYRVKPLLPVLYVVLFFARVGLETAFLGVSPFAVPTPTQFDALSALSVVVLFVVDALWGMTTGFLVGRSAAVYRAWKHAESTSASPAADTPLR